MTSRVFQPRNRHPPPPSPVDYSMDAHASDGEPGGKRELLRERKARSAGLLPLHASSIGTDLAIALSPSQTL